MSDYSALKFWFDVAQFILTCLVGVYVYLSNRQRVTNQRISSMEDHIDVRLDDHGDRLTRLEQDAHHAPNHDDLKRLHRRIDDVNGELKEIKGQTVESGKVLSLIHQHLLEQRK